MADDYNPLSSSWNAYNRVDSCEVEVNVSTHELGAQTTRLLFFIQRSLLCLIIFISKHTVWCHLLVLNGYKVLTKAQPVGTWNLKMLQKGWWRPIDTYKCRTKTFAGSACLDHIHVEIWFRKNKRWANFGLSMTRGPHI